MGKRTTYYAIDRKLLKDELWLSEPFTRGQAWVDLIGRASYEDGTVTKRGELLVSERGLAKRWKWPKTKVHEYLVKLEKDGMITRTTFPTINKTTNSTTIRIENYEVYQSSPTTKPTTNPTTFPTSNKNKELKNISLNMPVGMLDEIKAKFGDRAEALIEDVRRYYESHPDKEFPGWVQAVTQFSANQARWGKRKKQRTIDELMEEAKKK